MTQGRPDLAGKVGVNVNYYFNSEDIGGSWDGRRKTRIKRLDLGYSDAEKFFDKENGFDRVTLAWDEEHRQKMEELLEQYLKG